LYAQESSYLGMGGEGAIVFTIRPDDQPEQTSAVLIEGSGLDVHLDFDGVGGYTVRVVTEMGESLSCEGLAAGEETTVAVRYLAAEGVLELITPDQYHRMDGSSWATPEGDGLIGAGYQGFLSQLSQLHVADPELDLLVLDPGSISETNPSVGELYRLHDVQPGTTVVEDSETANGVNILAFSHDVASGGYHAPSFEEPTVTVTIEENLVPEDPIYQAIASDDDGDDLVFSLLQTDGSDRFYVDPLTGEVWMNEPANYEDQDQYKLTIQASDGVLSSSMELTLDVIDVPEYRAAGTVSYWKDPSAGIDGEIVMVSADDQASGTVEAGTFNLDDLLPGDYSVSIHAEPVEGRKYTAMDAILTMKMAVGLIDNPNPYALIAADVNQNGRVTSSDALDILKLAVQHETAPDEQFIFLDDTLVAGDISKGPVRYTDDISDVIESDTYDVDIVAVLLGDVDGSYSSLI